MHHALQIKQKKFCNTLNHTQPHKRIHSNKIILQRIRRQLRRKKKIELVFSTSCRCLLFLLTAWKSTWTVVVTVVVAAMLTWNISFARTRPLCSRETTCHLFWQQFQYMSIPFVPSSSVLFIWSWSCMLNGSRRSSESYFLLFGLSSGFYLSTFSGQQRCSALSLYLARRRERERDRE